MKTYLEMEDSNPKGDADTNLTDRLIIHVLCQSAVQKAVDNGPC